MSSKSTIKKRKTRGKKPDPLYIPNNEDIPLSVDSFSIEFPFKSKQKFDSVQSKLRNKTFKNKVDLNPKKQQKKYQRPYYSPRFLGWECDLVFFTEKTKKPITYMFVINLNTKFLYVIYLTNKDNDNMIDAFMNLFNYPSDNVQCPEGLRMNSIRFDGEKALVSKRLTDFFKDRDIKFYSNPSPYINKSRVVDRVIRTIRTAFDNLNIGHLSLSEHRKTMQKIVSIYNNTVHRTTGLKPAEMTFEQELEWIKNKENELFDQMEKVVETDRFDFEKGEEVLIYLPTGKTDRFTKKHIYYSTRGEFVKMDHGNAVCEVDGLGLVTVPLYFVSKTVEVD